MADLIGHDVNINTDLKGDMDKPFYNLQTTADDENRLVDNSDKYGDNISIDLHATNINSVILTDKCIESSKAIVGNADISKYISVQYIVKTKGGGVKHINGDDEVPKLKHLLVINVLDLYDNSLVPDMLVVVLDHQLRKYKSLDDVNLVIVVEKSVNVDRDDWMNEYTYDISEVDDNILVYETQINKVDEISHPKFI